MILFGPLDGQSGELPRHPRHHRGHAGHTLALTTRLLPDARDAFTGDTVTLHLQAGDEVQFVKAVLFADGHAIIGDGYRHLPQPVRMAP
ncbi:hypothetical protein [Actinacidiphila soli]|uniref:hypothetical protein n=1 Tax=Actinacidiphila soli TaxID=2487275 RepID=UPI000FCAEC58|nr:hypothetical protein [Actinacidiphila soli]